MCNKYFTQKHYAETLGTSQLFEREKKGGGEGLGRGGGVRLWTIKFLP